MVQDGGCAAHRRPPSLSARLLGASLALTALVLVFTALTLNGGAPRTPWDAAGSQPADLLGAGVGLGGVRRAAAGLDEPQRLQELDAGALGPEWRQELDEDDDADAPDGDADSDAGSGSDSDSDERSGDSARTDRQKAHLISKVYPKPVLNLRTTTSQTCAAV